MKFVMKLVRKVVYIITVYTQQQGRPDEEKHLSRERLEDKISKMNESKAVLIRSSMNPHVGCIRSCFADHLCRFGFCEKT